MSSELRVNCLIYELFLEFERGGEKVELHIDIYPQLLPQHPVCSTQPSSGKYRNDTLAIARFLLPTSFPVPIDVEVSNVWFFNSFELFIEDYTSHLGLVPYPLTTR